MPQMHSFKVQSSAVILLGAFAFLGMTDVGSAPEQTSRVSAEQFVRAVAMHQSQLINMYFAQGMDLNARVGQDRPVLVSAILHGNKATAQRLIEAGACVDLADANGLTPLMAASLIGDLDLVQRLLPLTTNPAASDHQGRTALHYAIAAARAGVVEVLLPAMPNLTQPTKDGRTVITMAFEQENPQLVDLILGRIPAAQQWKPETLQILQAALASGHKDQVKSLLAKHSGPPMEQGKQVPLLGYAIAAGKTAICRMLIDCGADPNTLLPEKCDPEFLALLPPRLREYIDGDKGVSILTLAAGLGQCEALHTLLEAGADRNRATLRFKMLPLYVAAQTGKWQCAQILLGGGPAPEQLRIEISLASQHAAVIKDGISIFDTICSTGRSGFSTRTGDYVITDKDRSHRSTIYKVEMPYFMRLSCLDFGMHEGVVPNYPASHGCIRLPGQAARKLFAEIPVGTLVTVK
jgi:ankyrin repeat protein